MQLTVVTHNPCMCSYITKLIFFPQSGLTAHKPIVLSSSNLFKLQTYLFHFSTCANEGHKSQTTIHVWPLYFSDDRIQFSGGKSITLSVNTVWQSNLNSCTSLFPARPEVFMLVLRVLVNWITFSPVQKKSRSLLLCVFLSPFCIFLNLILFLFYCLSV